MILSSDDIGNNYYGAPPAVIRERATWLGLFIKQPRSDQQTRESHLAVTTVSFALQKEPGPTVYRLVTSAPGADLLLSGVPRLSPGPVTTLGQFIDFVGETREVEFRLSSRQYRICLDSKEPNYSASRSFVGVHTLLYLRLRRLVPLAIAHSVMDGASVLISVLLPVPRA